MALEIIVNFDTHDYDITPLEVQLVGAAIRNQYEILQLHSLVKQSANAALALSDSDAMPVDIPTDKDILADLNAFAKTCFPDYDFKISYDESSASAPT